jgi:tripartite-type tricarboxylate transporter receptor subunit TctC
LESDAIKSNFTKQSFESAGCTPAELAQLIKSDREMWAATVAASGFTPLD